MGLYWYYKALTYLRGISVVPSNQHKKTRTQLKQLDRLACTALCPMKPSIATESLITIFGLTPLNQYLKECALRSFVRQRDLYELGWSGTNRNKKYNKSHRKVLHELAEAAEIPLVPCDQQNKLAPRTLFRVVLDSFTGQAKYKQHSQVNVYVDGSKDGDNVGAGAAICFGKNLVAEQSVTLPKHTTVFLAEIAALKLGAHMLNELKTSPTCPKIRFVKIFLDSQQALKAVGDFKIKSKSVDEAICTLNLATEGP